MDFRNQYRLVQSARKALLDFCESLSPDDFLKPQANSGKGSIRDLLVHNANTYEGWIGQRALGKYGNFTSYESIKTVEDATTLFACIDMVVNDFILKYKDDANLPLSMIVRGQAVETTSLGLFTHVITHEFHHKGQIMARARALGYEPIDTDVIRF